jgi:hypothetical protein
MKITFLAICLAFSLNTKSQSFELEQLSLDLQKLSGLKDILSQLYKGYEILNEGYQAIKDISEGNFNLHKAFLDGLLAVSPAVKNYQRVAGIITNETNLISEWKGSFSRFKQDKHFTPDELTYIGKVYAKLIDESAAALSGLTDILTAGNLRMSDDERLSAIDLIWEESSTRLDFLRNFNAKTTELAIQRAAAEGDLNTIKLLN